MPLSMFVENERDVSEAFRLKIKEISKRAEQNKSNARFIDINLAKRIRNETTCTHFYVDMVHVYIITAATIREQIKRSIDPLPLCALETEREFQSA